MSSTEHSRTDVAASSDDRRLSPRAVDWFWRPWYAKALWILAAIYWAAFYGMLLVPADRLNNGLGGAMILLAFVFNPITVVSVLGYGF